MKQTVFQPGVILQEVIVGAFRSQGTTFGAWCTDNKVHQTSARQATFGLTGGDTGKALLKRIIDAAGRDVVEMTYRKRMDQHVNRLKSGAAA
ncbi:MAG: hypothetical protein COB39_03470 [Marinosulfonomonas sp.]|nr:MAG: hypothetical protein COB39_03470 [Marinosulfonomonas sp.]